MMWWGVALTWLGMAWAWWGVGMGVVGCGHDGCGMGMAGCGVGMVGCGYMWWGVAWAWLGMGMGVAGCGTGVGRDIVGCGQGCGGVWHRHHVVWHGRGSMWAWPWSLAHRGLVTQSLAQCLPRPVDAVRVTQDDDKNYLSPYPCFLLL